MKRTIATPKVDTLSTQTPFMVQEELVDTSTQRTSIGKWVSRVVLALLLGISVEGKAQDTIPQDGEVLKKERITQLVNQLSADTVIIGDDSTAGLKLEPDPEPDSEGEPNLEGGPDPKPDSEINSDGPQGGDKLGEKSESPTKFTISTGFGYSVGGKTFMGNRVAGFGTMFKGSPLEMNTYTHVDFDGPMHTEGSGKLTLGKSVYKGITLDGDYTFTGTGGNILRFGIGYGGKIGKGQYGVNLYPLNTNGSPIAAKVSFKTFIGKDGQASAFAFVDFGNMQYYSELEYVHNIAECVAAFIQLRLGGVLDGDFEANDSQKIVGGLRLNIK